MFFEHRAWQIREVDTANELARKLTQQTWCSCAGFFVSGHPDYLFLNDWSSPDGAAEYGVVKGGLTVQDRHQVESITFSWCSEKKALRYIRQALAGEFDEFSEPVTIRVETPGEHGSCGYCS